MRQGSFIYKLLEILRDTSNHHLIHWSANGTKFTVTNKDEFATVILPRYFKHSNFASFVRQLHLYGFHKSSAVNSKASEFSHPKFIQGRDDLIYTISRRGKKSSKSIEPPAPLGPGMTEISIPSKTEDGNVDISVVMSLRKQLDDLKEENRMLNEKNKMMTEQMQHMQQDSNLGFDYNFPFGDPSAYSYPGYTETDNMSSGLFEDRFYSNNTPAISLPPVEIPSTNDMPMLSRHPSFENINNVPDVGEFGLPEQYDVHAFYNGFNDMGNMFYDVSEMDMDSGFYQPPNHFGYQF
jgi:hypothetical protein